MPWPTTPGETLRAMQEAVNKVGLLDGPDDGDLSPEEAESAGRAAAELRGELATEASETLRRYGLALAPDMPPATDEQLKRLARTIGVPERQAGAVAAAYMLQCGSATEADRADAEAIALDVPSPLRSWLKRDVTPQHLAGAADFFRRLANALHGEAARMRGEAAVDAEKVLASFCNCAPAHLSDGRTIHQIHCAMAGNLKDR